MRIQVVAQRIGHGKRIRPVGRRPRKDGSGRLDRNLDLVAVNLDRRTDNLLVGHWQHDRQVCHGLIALDGDIDRYLEFTSRHSHLLPLGILELISLRIDIDRNTGIHRYFALHIAIVGNCDVAAVDLNRFVGLANDVDGGLVQIFIALSHHDRIRQRAVFDAFVLSYAKQHRRVGLGERSRTVDLEARQIVGLRGQRDPLDFDV